MGYDFTVKNGMRVKKAGQYPWPCVGESLRTIDLDEHDVLSKQENGKYLKQTGLACFDIILKDDEVEPIGKDIRMRIS